ncbi:MAG TPA: SAM-dependent methyltransferase [Kofleriaceae bacterium]|jgi:methyltransferase (TIGR00027 family)|nr:SAM-dependent methyltransferase [Kofleriaceae bacterium]
MKAGTPSRTAAWVAAARGMARQLPPEARLADDPYGTAFEDGLRPRLQRLLDRAGISVHKFPFVTPWILCMQVRTRVIDDAVRAFVASGGRQLVVLGAGYDTRALRLDELASAQVFEIDHPDTQVHKRDVLDRLGARSASQYIAWDFESRPLADLPGVLAMTGHDPSARTLTIWEGVTMYLTEPAIDASLRAIRTWSSPGSQLAMSYFALARLDRPTLPSRVVQAIVSRVGEPWKWGWDPDTLPGYLDVRGWHVDDDATMTDAARRLLPADFAKRVHAPDQRIALATAR